MKKRLPLLLCQRWLLGAWLAGLVPVFSMVIWQTQRRLYKEPQDVWEWFLPHVMPTLSLLIGVVVTNEVQKRSHGTITPHLFALSGFMSAGYVVALTFAVVMSGAAPDRLVAMRTSTFYLGPLQGLVSGVLGALFVSTNLVDSPDSVAPSRAGPQRKRQTRQTSTTEPPPPPVAVEPDRKKSA